MGKTTYQSLLSLVLLWCLALPVQAQLTASVSSTTISANQSVELQISSDDLALLNQLPIEKLEALFEITGKSTSQQLQIINGRTKRTATLNLTLFPNQTGTLIIPALAAKGQTTNPIPIRVTETTQNGQIAQDDFASLELVIDDQNADSTLIQQQRIITQRLTFRADKFTNGNLSGLQVSGAQIIHLGEQRFDQIRDNQNWRVIEQRYAMFPQQSGQLNIDPVTFSGIVILGGRSLLPNGRNYRIRSNKLNITITPPAYTDAPWLPTTNLTATNKISSNRVTTGQAITRTVVLRARNQLSELLPELPLPQINEVQSYLDNVNRNNERHQNGIDGVITIKHVFIPEKSGSFTIPEQQIVWFNTTDKRRELLRIPATSFEATSTTTNNTPNTPATNIDSSSPTEIISSGNETSSPSIQHWLLYALAGLLFISLSSNIFFWRRSRSTVAPSSSQPSTNSENEQFALLADKQLSDPKNWLAACNIWLHMLGAEQVHSVQGIAQLVRKYNHQPTNELLKQLEAWFYQDGTKPYDLVQHLQAIRAAYGYPKVNGVYNSSLGG